MGGVMISHSTTNKTNNMDNNTFFKRFENINSLVTYLDKAKVSSTWANKDKESQHVGSSEWYGYDTYTESRDKLLHGDKELQQRLRGSEKLDMNIPCTGTRKQMCTGVVGFMPHVPNFLAGVPNNMIYVREKQVKQRTITIVYNIACLGGSSAEEVTCVSARIMSAIMSVERQGYRCNLFAAAAQTERCCGQRCGFIVKIKDSGQHIDTLKMALPMISPAMNRRFGFRFRETMEGLKRNWVDGYGSSMNQSELKQFLNDVGFKYDVALAYESVKAIKNVEELEQMFIDGANQIKNKH